MKKCFLFITGIVLPCLFLAAQKAPQSKALTVGDRVPELYFKEMINYSKGSARLSDFKDKVVILDFWATYCPPCVTGLIHLSSMQQEFKNDIMVLPIDKGRYGDTRAYVTNFLQKRKDILLPTCYDTANKFSDYFPHAGIPYCVVIGKDRIVKALTKSSYVTADYLQALIAGKKATLPVFALERITHEQPLSSIPAFINTADYRCLISGFIDGYIGHGLDLSERTTRMNIINWPITSLYALAFGHFDYGVNGRIIYSNPKDSALLKMPPGSEREQDEWAAKNSYCVELTVPKALTEKRYELLKKELDNYFGALFGLHPRLETRKMNCLKLVAVDDTATIRMKSDKEMNRPRKDRWFGGVPMKEFIESMNNSFKTIPFINSSGYDGPVSLGFTGRDKNNFLTELKESVQEIGLRIEETEGDVEFIVF